MDGGAADGNQPLFRAFAAGAHHAFIQIYVADQQPRRFRCAQAAGVDQLQQRPITLCGGRVALWCGEEHHHLVAAQHLRQAAGLARRAQLGGRVVVNQLFAPEVAIERTQAGGLALQGCGGNRRTVGPALRQLVKEACKLAMPSGKDVCPTLLEVKPKLHQIGSISPERVAREAALQLEVGEEVEHVVLKGSLRGSGRDRHWGAVRRRAAPSLPLQQPLRAAARPD